MPLYQSVDHGGSRVASNDAIMAPNPERMISVSDYQNELAELKGLATTVLKTFEGDPAETFKTSSKIPLTRTRFQVYMSLHAALNAPEEEKNALLVPSGESEVYKKISSAADLRKNVLRFMRVYSSLLNTTAKKDAQKVYGGFKFQFREAGIYIRSNGGFKVRPL